jgi:hypothetical protein
LRRVSGTTTDPSDVAQSRAAQLLALRYHLSIRVQQNQQKAVKQRRKVEAGAIGSRSLRDQDREAAVSPQELSTVFATVEKCAALFGEVSDAGHELRASLQLVCDLGKALCHFEAVTNGEIHSPDFSTVLAPVLDHLHFPLTQSSIRCHLTFASGASV